MRVLRLLLVSITVVVAIGYGCLLFSPLRLNTDSMDYLKMLRSAEAGEGFYPDEATRRYPAGYPGVLLALSRLGLAEAPWFVGLNLVCLAAGLAALVGILRRSSELGSNAGMLVLLLTLLSYVFLKHTALAMADVPFFGLSMVVLYALRRAEEDSSGSRWGWLAIAGLLTAAAIPLRTVGVALVPAMGWAALGPVRTRQLGVVVRTRPLHMTGLALTVLAAAAIGVFYFGRVYLQQAEERFQGGWMAATWLGRLVEFAELALNIPENRVPFPARSLFVGTGAVLVVFLGAVLWSRRRAWTGLDIYVITYAAILVVWPFNDARFWLPVMPVFALVVVEYLSRRGFRLIRWAAAGVGAVFLLGGALALGYSIRLSLAGERFALLYGDSMVQAGYRAAWHPEERRAELPPTVKDMVDLLVRYDPFTKRHAGRKRVRPD
jgi:hypothetical protein